jgi:apolipoprotein N-acyltransferase
MRNIIFLFLPLISAFLIIPSFPPCDLGFLAWVGMAPLLYAMRRSGVFAAGGMAWLTGVLFFAGTFFWAGSVEMIGVRNWLLFMVAPVSLYFLLFGILYPLVYRSSRPWIIFTAPALWVALEYVRSNLSFLAMPWNLLGHSQYRYLPVIQIADIAGVYGISFLLMMVNQLLSQMPEYFSEQRLNPTHTSLPAERRSWVVTFLAAVLLLGVVFSYGFYKLKEPESGKHLRVALVQANVVAEDKMPLAEQAKHLQAYEVLTREAASSDPDLIVWPASSLPAPIEYSRLVRYNVRRIVRETGTYILMGGAGHEKLEPRKEGYRPFSNSEFLISPKGRIEAQYDKMRLLPFNEYVPLQGRITWPKWITTPKDSFLAGEKLTLFEVKGARFGAPICWENMLADQFRLFVAEGAHFMVSATNDSFMGRSAGPYQVLAMNAFRAVENRVAVVRSAVTGVSAFINPYGAIVERVRDSDGDDLFVSGILVRNIALSESATIYTLYGDLFVYVVISLAALIVLAPLFARKWRRSPNQESKWILEVRPEG